MPTPPVVRLATRDELPAVARVLARAFTADPIWEWLAPPTDQWERLATAWFLAEARVRLDADAEIWVDDDVRAAAVWTPPGRWRSAPLDTVRLAWPTLRLMRGRILRGVAMMNAMERKHPNRPEHWYLALLGTDPSHQGLGLGGALLRTVTDRCDRDGLPAYLESSKLTNVGYYERFGFVRTGEVTVQGSPPQTTMWRDPKEPG